MSYNIGDRVAVKGSYYSKSLRGLEGTVVTILGTSLGVKFSDPLVETDPCILRCLHNLSGYLRESRGRWFSADEITAVNPTNEDPFNNKHIVAFTFDKLMEGFDGN